MAADQGALVMMAEDTRFVPPRDRKRFGIGLGMGIGSQNEFEGIRIIIHHVIIWKISVSRRINPHNLAISINCITPFLLATN